MGHELDCRPSVRPKVKASNKMELVGFRSGAWRVPRPLAVLWPCPALTGQLRPSLRVEVIAQLVTSLSPLALKLKVKLFLAFLVGNLLLSARFKVRRRFPLPPSWADAGVVW